MNLSNYQNKSTFSQKHLLTLQDYTPDEILQILSLALKLKAKPKYNPECLPCMGKTLAMIFTKSSTRTRVSFEAGFSQLGGKALFLSKHDIQLGRGEPIEDTAKVLGRMVDGIMIRTFKQSDVRVLADNSGIPVINGLTDDYHPCQVLADLLTYYEHKQAFKGKLAYVGDGNNMAHSLLIGCSKIGLDVAIASPKGYQPAPHIVALAKQNAQMSGGNVLVTEDPREAVQDADCIYTDVWASMGQEEEQQTREKAFTEFQVNDTLASDAKPDFIFQHCLPAHRGEEVTADIIDGKHSVVFDEAENRLHVQKAVMIKLIGDRNE